MFALLKEYIYEVENAHIKRSLGTLNKRKKKLAKGHLSERNLKKKIDKKSFNKIQNTKDIT